MTDPSVPSPAPPIAFRLTWSRAGWRGFALAIALAGGLALLGLGLPQAARAGLSSQALSTLLQLAPLPLALAVAVSAAVGGLGPGLLAATIAAGALAWGASVLPVPDPAPRPAGLILFAGAAVGLAIVGAAWPTWRRRGDPATETGAPASPPLAAWATSAPALPGEVGAASTLLAHLHRLSQAVGQAAPTPVVCDLALSTLQAFTAADQAAIVIFEPDATPTLPAAHRLHSSLGQALRGLLAPPAGPAEPGLLAAERQPPPEWATVHAAMQAAGQHSAALFPLAAAGQQLGYLAVFFERPRQLAAADHLLVETVAHLLGSAVRRRQAEAAEAHTRIRARQQAAVAALGRFALTETSLDRLMAQATRRIADTLDVEMVMVLERLPEGHDLLLRAGIGWKPGLVGRAIVSAGLDSQAGYTLVSDEPVLVDDLRLDGRFSGPALLHDHDVRGGLSVVIRGREQPYGVLGAHTARRRHFTPDDALFMRAMANVLAAAVQRARIEAELRLARDQTTAVLAAVAEGVTVQEASGSLVYANDIAARLIGFSSVAELLATPVREVMARFEVFDEAGEPVRAEQLPGRRALLGESPPPITLRFVQPATGVERWSVVSARPVLSTLEGDPQRPGQRAGQVVLAVNVFHDVTDLKRAELSQRLLAEAGSLLARSLEVEAQLAGMVQLVVPHLADSAAIYAAQGGQWHCVAQAGPGIDRVLPGAELAHRLEQGQGAVYGLAGDWSGEPVLLLASPPAPGLRAAMVLPLRSRGRLTGFWLLARTTSSRTYTPADVALAAELARRLALATENARLYTEAQAANLVLEQRVAERTAALQAHSAELRALARRLQAVREEERAHMAREIHDVLGGALTGLKLDLTRLHKSAAEGAAPGLAEQVHATLGAVDELVQTVRRIAHELRPAVLDDFGLAAAIEWQLAEFQSRSGIACQVLAAPDEVPLDTDAATGLFRVFQETLTNVARHAQATRVEVSLVISGPFVELHVRDNGRGFKPNELHGGRSLGLVGMRERVRLLNGELRIDSAPGRGTLVIARVPARPAAPLPPAPAPPRLPPLRA